ncbi:DUF4142 domain-containing protein [Streptomyces klenkii]|uniref:DUF4142 domain-containing protein n=1 Tax=Streptomyces klenkii TaxID=1420899 RepID=UPI00339E3759
MRMGHRFTAAAAALVLAAAPAGAALACDKGHETGSTSQDTAETKPAKKPGKKPGTRPGKRTNRKAETDGTFLKAAHQAGLAEIAMSRDAGKNAVMPCVKKTAELLVKDHTRMDKELRELARRLKVTLPGETSEQRKSLRDMRRKAHRREYDTLWLKAAEAGHVQALELLDAEITGGKNAEVREAARMARPIVAAHLTKVQVCQKER